MISASSSTEATFALALIVFIQWLKKTPYFPWLSQQSAKANRLAAIVGSGLSSFGIHFNWSASNHSLLITGLSLTVVLPALYHWGIQFLYTHAGYKGVSAVQDGLTLLQELIQVQRDAGPNMKPAPPILPTQAPKA